MFLDVGNGKGEKVSGFFGVACTLARFGGLQIEKVLGKLRVAGGGFSVERASELHAVLEVFLCECASYDGVLLDLAGKPFGVDVAKQAGFIDRDTIGLDAEGDLLHDNSDGRRNRGYFSLVGNVKLGFEFGLFGLGRERVGHEGIMTSVCNRESSGRWTRSKIWRKKILGKAKFWAVASVWGGGRYLPTNRT